MVDPRPLVGLLPRLENPTALRLSDLLLGFGGRHLDQQGWLARLQCFRM